MKTLDVANNNLTNDKEGQLSAHSNVNTQCLVIGDNIDAVTSAVVLASLGHQVTVYAQQHTLLLTLNQYGFESHLQALWHLYEYQKQLVVVSQAYKIEEQSEQEHNAINATGINDDDGETDINSPIIPSDLINHDWSLIWAFYDHIEQSQDEGIQAISQAISSSHWIETLNCQDNQQVPVIWSGTASIQTFSGIAEQLQRAWVYYVPFVFMQEGRALNSMLNPKLLLIGEKTPDSWYRLTPIQALLQRAATKHIADIVTIEFARTSIMGMLATRVSFINEMSRLADAKGVDITDVSHIMGKDERIGSSYLQAGWGFGGRTLPSEVAVLTRELEKTQVSNHLIQAVNTINEDQKELIFRKLWQHFDGVMEDRTVMIWGGGYKSGSGRTSGSAIHTMLPLLWSYNITTLIYAEEATEELNQIYAQAIEQGQCRLVNQRYQPLTQSHALVIVTWSDIRSPEVSRLNDAGIPIFDAVNCIGSKDKMALNVPYHGIGR